jgi:hypothetical protein
MNETWFEPWHSYKVGIKLAEKNVQLDGGDRGE